MGKSKNLFLMMQEREIQTEHFVPNKKEVQFSAKKFVADILEAGEVDRTELFTQAIRIQEAIQVITENLKPDTDFQAYGVNGQVRNGGSTPNYSDDEKWQELKKQLTDRESLLKVAMKSTETIYDSEGCEVPKVSENHRKSSLIVTW